MKDADPPQAVYIDTSALRGMQFYRDVARLLAESKAERISLHICETTLWERGRQQHENDVLADRLIPFRTSLGKYLAWFKSLFEEYGVTIIPTNKGHLERVANHIENETAYFKKEDENDQRDALVLAAAELDLDRGTLILCHDKALKSAFIKMGFSNICPDINRYLQLLIEANPTIPALIVPDLSSINDGLVVNTFSKPFQGFIQVADSRSQEYLVTLPTLTDKLNAILANMQELDAEMRRRILGYTQWFSPIGKKDLHDFLAPIGYEPAHIEANAQRLKQENLLQETEYHWLTNNEISESKEICEQAMSTVMPEILKLLELLE